MHSEVGRRVAFRKQTFDIRVLISDGAFPLLFGDAVWVRFGLTRLETRTKESKYLRECMFVNLMRAVKAAAGIFVPAAYFDSRRKV